MIAKLNMSAKGRLAGISSGVVVEVVLIAEVEVLIAEVESELMVEAEPEVPSLE